jgi:oxygen-independent coproporphyrinogen-3 oxidase
MTLPAALSAEILAEHATRGPRYTSYPPATEFGPLAHERVVRELELVRAERQPISLYVHIPFCRSLCHYCGCNVIPTRDTSKGDKYVDTLATEAAVVADILGRADKPTTVAEIALGGGSPNFLSPTALRTLIRALRNTFDIATDARMSIELDPRTTTSSQIGALATLGFRSLSVGVQDFSPQVQDAIHRHQTLAQTRWLLGQARRDGFDDMNVDIVYGLPRQSETSFLQTIDDVLGLAPERIALFGYAHLPDRLPHQRLVERAGRVLDRYERATLLIAAIKRITDAGYLHLGLDHFAKPGSPLARAAEAHAMRRSFQGYVVHKADTLLGLGVSAISSTPRMFWQNHTELQAWESAVANACVPVARGTELDEDDRIRRMLIERLMCDGEVDLGMLAQRFGIDPVSYFAAELAALRQQGELVSFDHEARTLRTTALGKLLVRNVCMIFDRYQRNEASLEARFSSTI